MCVIQDGIKHNKGDLDLPSKRYANSDDVRSGVCMTEVLQRLLQVVTVGRAVRPGSLQDGHSDTQTNEDQQEDRKFRWYTS